ncbi:helix-turn-helix transcriptional regulator [Haloechinothrix sp. YIM 98757]|uniref:Helix-turn-helix transcriptional regulator n=2 Tax=Haloechinothrix aidingensis TaxID=2752311 RepID=A0A838AC59_9PSEU|nr:TetR/AcrR family transcriptional regulator [Haloechinothrix aidingensis]MBA0126758.1 helix-turn-helix transcriptional regulator [Haloechinothrix aidingensis]
MRAAERCIDRHGIRKTTMDDIAREAGISRPSVYRYFQDREDLLIALMAEHSRALNERAHRFIEQQPTFEDALVEGLLYVADHGRRDPFTRHLVKMDDSELTDVLDSTGSAADFAREFWGGYLDAAVQRGEMSAELDTREVYRWLAEVGLMLMRLMERDQNTADEYRSMIRTFVLPAFRSG